MAGAMFLCVGLSGCAAGTSGPTSQEQGCSLYVSVSPTSGTADHAAVSPGNQVQFQTVSGETCTNGASPAVLARIYSAWSNPDPLDVTISSAADVTNGLATCKNTTAGAVTLTATGMTPGAGGSSYSKTVELTCK